MTAAWPTVPPVQALPGAARYVPFAHGRFDVKAGLAALGTDFGNGAADGQVFQFDAAFAAFRANKLRARADGLARYVARSPAFAEPVSCAVAEAIARRLAAEHPQDFALAATPAGATLSCRLTGERLGFDPAWRLAEAPAPPGAPAYVDAFDALVCQLPEDVAVVVRRVDGSDEAAAIHLCAANHWSAADKVGHSFVAIHQVVPGMEPVNRRARQMVDAIVDRGPFVRFVWGIATDTRLNHHPEAPTGVDPHDWAGRRFDPARPRLFVRLERQVLLGLPSAGAALFAIRPSFLDGEALRADAALNAALRSALASMTPEQARYKGVTDHREAILAWLLAAG